MMQELVGIVRVEDEMVRALDGIQKLKERSRNLRVEGNRMYNAGWHTAIDVRNLLTMSEAICRGAIERRESRGAHYRVDYPEKSEKFAKVNTVLHKGEDGAFKLRLEPIKEMPAELKQIIEEMK
jgi:succinate dehydrogenase / fumarate reductase flavoprotein subunit